MIRRHARIRRSCAAVAVTLGALLGTACNLGNILNPPVNTANDAVAAVQDAIDKISAQSSSWQSVLQSTLQKLTSDAQSSVRVELQTLLDNSIAAVQVGVMCTTDFVGRRVVSALEAIKAELLGKTPPTPSPFVCSSAPLAVEFAAWQQNRVPIVTLTGFDLKVPLQVKLVQTTGTTVVPNVLAEVSPYQATINLGSTGLHLTTLSQRIVVATTAQPPVELSAINVIQPQPNICQEKDLPPATPGVISFTPMNHTRGDSEFDGHGPHITAHLVLTPVGSSMNYTFSMTAAETVSDFTTVTGSTSGTLSLSPPVPSGLRILRVNGPTVSDADYIDHDLLDDHIPPSNGGPVSEFVFVGDTSGNDVGITRLKSATFHSISLHVVETTNCVTATEAKTLLQSATTLTPELSTQLREALKSQPQ